MGRRKQSPSKNLGAVETRSTYRAALTQSYTQPASDEGDSKSSDDDIEAEHQAPERKRRRLDPYAAAFASEEAVSTEIEPGLHDALPFCLRQLQLQQGGQHTASGPSDISELEHKLLLPSTRYGGPYGAYHDDANLSLSVKNRSGDSTIVGKLHVPHHIKRELYACLTAGHIVYRLHQSKDRDRVALEICLSQDAFAVDVKEPDAHNRSRAQQEMLAVLMWLMPQLSPQLRTPDGQVAASTPRKPRVLSSPSSPHSPNAAGPSQAFDEVVEDIAEADAMEIYTAVKPTGKERELEANLPQLTSTLHSHQRRAAAWMVDRERGAQVKKLDKECAGELHPLWRKVTCIDGQIFYVNPFNGLLSRTPFPAPDPVPGGILADEMGMGKTVELLACILAHRFSGPVVPAELESDAVRPKHERIDCMCLVQKDTPSDEGDYTGMWVQCDECQAWLHGLCVGLKKAPKREYICPKCIRAQANATVTVDCGATLIVSPASILQQWQTEIAKHTHPDALKVLVYEHISSDSIHGAPSRGLSARDFAAADIVLTTYETLQKDVNRQGNIRTYSFRQAKKYEVLPTPLTRLRWFRICLDEAQMVESTTAKAARIAVNIEAQHRWCITGTPLSRGLEDLYGLFYFLHARPYSDSSWWHEVLQRPYMAGCPEGRRRLMAQLRPAQGGFFWRTSKADVAHELALPPQSHRTTFLTLSAIERHFYMRQHQECAAKARAVLPTELLTALEAGRAGDEAFRRLTQAEEKSLLKSLLRLRQACCHPQVGSRGIKALTAAKTPMTMDSILEVLVEKARVEAEDAQRILLSALNGLAGLMLIDDDKGQAVALYRQVLATAEANKALIRLDPLQKLHTLSNLADLLKGGSMPGVPRTLRDDSLQAEADKIREEYLVQWVAKVAAAEKDYTSALDHMNRPGTGEQSDAATKSAGPPSSGRAAPISSSGCWSLDEEECWYLDAIDLLLQYSDDQGDRVATAVRDHLAARDEVRRKHEKNATSMARRFSSLAGLKLLLKNELAASATAREKALKTLHDLTDIYHERPDSLVEQAATCGRCRSELGEAGRVCRHCKMDDVWVAWEIRLFRVETRAMEAGAYVSAEDALRQAQAAMLRHIGRGGLNEEAGVASASDAVPEVGRREGENVSTVDIVRQPSEAEQVLRMLPGQLRSLKHLPTRAVGQRNALLAVAKTALERLEAGRRVFLRGRALALAQRFALYARDELAMSTLRIRVRVPGEHVKPHEVHFKLHPAELPVKNKELTTERIVAEADLNKQLGTVRYLRGLRAARQRMQAATTHTDQTSGQQGALGTGSNEAPGEVDMCPVCQDPLGQELTMLPCGHQLCVRCHMAIVDRIPPNTPMAVRHIHCPTCRARTKVADIALVDAGRSAAKEEGQSSALADEEQIPVCGSYSAKIEAVVRRVKWLTRSNANTKLLVFSTWAEVLLLLEHALKTNSVPHVRPTTRKAFEAAIRTFKEAPKEGSRHVQTLLLLLKQGANGLNLTEAQHVLLVEPVLDPAVEEQAIGRIHRIGQVAATTVHRFVVGATVEENVHKMCAARAAAMDMQTAVHRVEAPLTVRDVSLLLDQSWGVKGPTAQEPGLSSGAGSGSEREGSEEDVSIV